MPAIGITVTNRIAQASGKPEIVCGNSDYNITFTFDSEWSALTDKTLQLAYYKNGAFLAQEVTFSGTSAVLPALYGITEVFVGVYAGNIRTTTPGRIACLPCITDLAFADGGGADPGSIAQIVARLGGLSFLKMTAEEYAALDVKDANTAYFVTDTADFTIYLGELPLSGGGGGGGGTPAPVQLMWSIPAVRSSRMVQMQIAPSGAWKCDPEWYYEGTRTAEIGGRGYAKTNAKPAIGFVSCVNAGGYYSTLMLISDDPDAVNNGVAGAASTSVQYGGVTWYATAYGYAQGGQWDDSTGHFITYPDVLDFDGATGTLTAQSIIDVLEYVHAVKNEEER